MERLFQSNSNLLFDEPKDLLLVSLEERGLLFSLSLSASLFSVSRVVALVNFGERARRGDRGNKGFRSKQGEFGALRDLKILASGGGM